MTGARRARRLALVVLVAAGASTCSGSGDPPAAPAGPAPVATVTVSATATSLPVGMSLKLAATTLSTGGAFLPGRAVAWATSDERVLTVVGDGTVTAVSVGSAVVTATSEGKSGTLALNVTANPVARIALSATALTLELGETRAVAARLVDAAGADVAGEPVRWSTSDANVATVSATGAVQAIAPGAATITAAASGRAATVTVTVPVPAVNDVAVESAVWTQGVQKPDGSIPLVLGTPAVLNVVLRGAGLPNARGSSAALPGELVLVLRDASGAVVRADTAAPRFPSRAEPPPTLAGPSAQFLVPASALRAGLTWRVVRDPRGVARDDSASNDPFPRAGDAPLRTVDLPALKIRFVPIVLSAHAGATGNVTTALLDDYLQTVRSTFPAGRVDATVVRSVTSGASFGLPPNGGEAPFWAQALQDLDLAHVAAGEADAYWYGVVRPPNGFNNTSYGGWGYVPANPAATAPGTRTALGVQAFWFSRPTQARDLVAHELAHNHGRRHAPCGGPDLLDPTFPFPSGTVGTEGAAHDVFSWGAGRTQGAAALPAATGDLMSYCFPLWASAYTYEALLAARLAQAPVAVVAAARAAPERLLVVQGQIEGTRVALRPAVTITAPAPPASSGPYRLEGRDAAGATLFARTFTPSALDHAALELFTIAVPLSDDAEARLAELVVTGPGGRTARRSTRRLAESMPVIRRTATAVDARCGEPSAAAIVVSDAATGAVLARGPGAAVTVPGVAPAALRVACSDGVRTTARVVR